MMRKLQDHDLHRLAEGIAEGLSCREVAARLGVSAATAIRWTKRCGLTSRRSNRLSLGVRAALQQQLREGASPAEAAARFGVSPRTAARLSDPAGPALRRQKLVDDLGDGLSYGEAAMRAGVSGSTARRWAHAAGLAPLAREKRLPRGTQTLTPERLAQRARLLATIATGISRRKAAALVGLPVATAIRWARRAGATDEAL